MSSHTANTFASKAKKAKRRAMRARLIYRLAVIAVVLLAGIVIVQSQWARGKRHQNTVPAQIPKQIGSAKINFSGMDDKARLFAIAADGAAQDQKTQTLIHLQQLIGRFSRDDGQEIAVSAKSAHYDVSTKQLSVEGDVILEQRDRFQLAMQSAEVDLGQQRLTSNAPVRIITPTADILANGIDVSEDGQKVFLKGRVKATFETDIIKD